MPVQAVQEPIAAARSPSPKTATMIPIVLGTSTAPAIPCSARKPTRTPASGASAHISDVAPKAATPATKTRRRPKMSPSEPPISRNDPRVRR
jgi:hypothetical protein